MEQGVVNAVCPQMENPTHFASVLRAMEKTVMSVSYKEHRARYLGLMGTRQESFHAHGIIVLSQETFH